MTILPVCGPWRSTDGMTAILPFEMKFWADCNAIINEVKRQSVLYDDAPWPLSKGSRAWRRRDRSRRSLYPLNVDKETVSLSVCAIGQVD
jgi:hypothetical protein